MRKHVAPIMLLLALFYYFNTVYFSTFVRSNWKCKKRSECLYVCAFLKVEHTCGN